MMKDIPDLRVKDLAIAIVPRTEEKELWDVYIINFKGRTNWECFRKL